LASGNRAVISDGNRGSGPAFIKPLSGALDLTNNRVLVADGVIRATLLWANLTSGDRSVMTDIARAGPILLNVSSVIIDHENFRAFAADVEIEGLVVTDLATGR
jgi:hypothetical protein